MAAALEAYVSAVNRHDVEAMLALRHPDAHLEIMGVAEPVVGIEALRAYYESAFSTATPDYILEIEGSAFGPDVASVWGRFRATLNAGGDAAYEVEAPVAFVCTFRDGLFCGDSMYFNAARLLPPERSDG